MLAGICAAGIAASLPAAAETATTTIGVVADFGSAGFPGDRAPVIAKAASGVASRLTGDSPSIILSLGDQVYQPAHSPPSPPTASQELYQQAVGNLYGGYLKDSSSLSGGGPTLRLFPVAGDHDWWGQTEFVDRSASTIYQTYALYALPEFSYEFSMAAADLYAQVFAGLDSLPASRTGSVASTEPFRWYDVVEGAVQVFALSNDPNELYLGGLATIDYQDAGAAAQNLANVQGQWLQQAVAASTAPWKIVTVHQPPASSSAPEETFGQTTSGLRSGHQSSTYFQLFDGLDVDLVLAGHVHSYERLHNNGIVYIVNGAGGTYEEFSYFCNQSGVTTACDVTLQNAPAFAGSGNATATSNRQMVAFSKVQVANYYGYQLLNLWDSSRILESQFWGSRDPGGADGTAAWNLLDDFFMLKGGTLTASQAGSATGLYLKAASASAGTLGGGTVDTAGATVSLNATIDGPGTLTVSGGGTLVLGMPVGRLNGSPTGSLTTDSLPAAGNPSRYVFQPNPASTWSGGTIVTGGTTLSIASDALLGAGSGGLTLDDGVLRSTAGLASARTITLASGGGTFETDADTALSGAIAGSGGLAKTGSATLTLSGPLSYAGTTSVQAGILALGSTVLATGGEVASGAILDGALSVPAGATFSNHGTITGAVTNAGTLTGSGRINGSLSNGGTVAPGNGGSAARSLTVDGGFTQGAGGRTVVRLGRGGADLLAVGGTAALDGTLAVTAGGGDLPSHGASYTILTASAVSGRFATVEGNVTPTLVAAAHYGSDRVTLDVARDYANPTLTGQHADAGLSAIGRALNEFAADPGAAGHPALSAIDAMPQTGHVVTALGQFQPVNPAGHARLGGQAATAQSDQIGRRLQGLRDAPAGAAAPSDAQSGLAAGDTVLPAGEAAMAGLQQLASVLDGGIDGPVMPIGLSDQGAGSGDRPLGVFVLGSGAWGYQDDGADREGYRFTLGGITAGVDYRVAPGLVLGLAGSYGEGSTRSQGGSDTTDSTTWTIGPYASWSDGAWYADAQASYGWTAYDNSRTVQLTGWQAVSTSDHDGRQLSAYLAGGRDFVLRPGLLLGPTAALRYSHAEIDGYTESGSNPFNLTVGSTTARSLQGSIGGRLRLSHDAGWGILLPELRLSYTHEFDSDPTVVNAQLTSGTLPFSSATEVSERNWLDLGAELGVTASRSLSLYLSGDLQYGLSGDNLAVSGNGGVRLRF